MKQLGVGVSVGVLVALLGSYLTGYLSAVAVPEGIGSSAVAHLLVELGTQLLGFGILSFVLMYFAAKLLYKKHWLVTAIVAVASVQVVLAVLSWPSYSFYLLHVIVLAASIALGGAASARNKSLKGDAASGAL
jgi:hypothetical protein